MANWISNKLKVAETFLQQIDQQAAESLGKGEKPGSDDLKIDTPTKSSSAVSLKVQLKKKTQENNDYRGKLHSDPNFKTLNRNDSISDPKPKSTLTDSDWTELLSTPEKPTTGFGNLRKDGRRNVSSLGNRSKKSNSTSVVKVAGRADNVLGSKLNGGKKRSDGVELGSSGRSWSAESQDDVKGIGGGDVKVKDEGSEEYDGFIKNHQLELVSTVGKVDVMPDVRNGLDDGSDRLRMKARGSYEPTVGSRTSTSDDLKRVSSSTSDNRSDPDSDSGSSSGSESEREREERRKRREKIFAEKVAAKAAETIKERENMVARMEGEKQSLEKILEERAKQQAKEASELQTTMMETMDAVELEKQRHNNTRMEVLARLAKLETTNAELARSLAFSQKKLEIEIDQVAELRRQIELKEVAHAELNRRISGTHQSGNYQNQLAASKGVEFEREILEAEYLFITDKVVQLQDKAKKLEANIEMTRKEIEDPTEVEIELKRRLGQLTDHLIQKQAQVESLSAEKATILFRIEAVSRLLEENKTMSGGGLSKDLESGAWELSQSKLKPLFEDKICAGRKHLGSLLRQLDSIFLAGMVFLRRNPSAKLWSMVYLVSLHFWVFYILMSHSQSTSELKSGAIFSLENINNTAL